jgi:GT2 family glycosyltransferase
VAKAAKTAGVACRTFVAVDVVGKDGRGEGGTKTANRALKAAVGTKYVCYINDDVSFPQKDWLKQLIQALEKNPRYGIAGPGGRCSTPQNRGKLNMPHGIVELKRLSFFCAVFKRAILDELGLLDEQFIHYGCDTDYCERAGQANWKCIWVQHVYVEHDRSPLIREWKDHDVAKFRRKWRS